MLNFAQLLNRNTRLVSTLYSTYLKAVVTGLEDVHDQLTFNFSYFARKMNGKLEILTEASSSQATSFTLGEYNLLPSILKLQLTNCARFNF